MQEYLSEISIEIRDLLIDVLQKGKIKQEFYFKETAKEKAYLIIFSLLASLILNKVVGDNITKNAEIGRAHV